MNEREPREQPAGPTDPWPAERSDVVFVYSGHGPRWSGMGRGLLATEPAFAEAIDDLDAIFQWEHGFSPREIFAGRRGMADITVGQSALFAVQVGLTALWRAHGVEPTAVLGRSTGEMAAAVAAGALNLTDAFRILARRAEPPRPTRPTLTCYSTVLADPRERPGFDGSWVADLHRPARLTRAIGAALADGHTRFVEISPHPVATRTIERAASGRSPVVVLPSLRRDRDEQATFLSSLAALHEAGYLGAPAPLASGAVTGQPVGGLDRVPAPAGSGPTSHAGAGVSSGIGAGAA